MASFMDCSPIFVIARHLRSFVPKRFWLSVKMKKGSFFFNSNVLGSLPAFQADTLRQAMLMGLLSYQAVKVHILSTKPKDFRYFTFRAAFVEDFVLDLFKDESLHDFFKLRALFADDEQRRRYLKRLAVAKAADPRYFFTTRQRWNKEKFFRSS
jgi:hypothetical protein